MNPAIFLPIIAEIIVAVREGRAEDAARLADRLASLARETDAALDALDLSTDAAMKRGGHDR